MDTKEPEAVLDPTQQTDDDDNDPIAHENRCSGYLALEGSSLTLKMGWHLDHDISKEYRKDFLKYRCYALMETFGKLKGVTGIRVQDNGEWGPDPSPGKPTVNKRKCSFAMGYFWPNLDNPNWEELKTKFIEIFDPASLHGNVLCGQKGTTLHIAGEFNLPEKGHSDA